MLPKFTGLDSGEWKVDPSTGFVSLTNESLKELVNKDPIEKWYIIDPEPIARGQFTVVYHCLHRVTGKEFAAKFSARWRVGINCSPELEHEIAVCAMLRMTNRAVQLVDVFSTDTEVVLVMEFAPGGDLQTLLDNDMVPFEKNVMRFMKNVLEALSYIHDRNIVHLDIKPQNLVLMGDFPDCDVKLCDFEISRMLTSGNDIREILGTIDYVAPEVIHYEPLTTKTDMWSVGVLVYVLLTGFLPFGGDTDQETFLEITRGELDFPEELFEDVSEAAIDFTRRLLIRQPHLRMSAKECLSHEWMNQVKNTIPNARPITNSPPQVTVSPSMNSVANMTSEAKLLPLRNSFSFSDTFKFNTQTRPMSQNGNLNIDLSDAMDTSPDLCSDKSTPPATHNLDASLGSAVKENGLPPLYPHVSSKTSQSAHSSTCSLNRGGSRQSLDRMRSMSKSREILVERLQLTSQKKIMSRSRERLFDGRFGLHYSKESILAQRSISHSVETLPPNDIINGDNDSIYSSNKSIVPVFSLLTLVEENNINNRHYRSLASIDQAETEYKNARNRAERKDSTSSYYSLGNPHDINCNFDYQSLVKGEASNHTYKQQPQPTETNKHKVKVNHTKLPKVFNAHNRMEGTFLRNNKIQKSLSSPAINKTNMRGTRQNNNKDSSAKIKNTNLNGNKKPTVSSPKYSSEQRRGSASHIEERIQKRHARMNQKENKILDSYSMTHQLTSTKKKPIVKPKLQSRKSSPGKLNQSACRSQKNLKQHSSDWSPSSSMESVKEMPVNTKQSQKAVNESSPHVQHNPICTGSRKSSLKAQTKPVNSDQVITENDEAIKERLFLRSDSIDSTNSDCTVKELDISFPGVEEASKSLATEDRAKQDSHELQCNSTDTTACSVNKSCTKSCEKVDTAIPTDSLTTESLTVITEEEEEAAAAVFARSISTCSDVSSGLSEISDTCNDELSKSRRTSDVDSKSRGRSRSMQTGAAAPPSSGHVLTRSNSLHLDSPLSGKARPWGDICSGSVDRAFNLFSQKSGEFVFTAPRKNSDPTSDRTPASACNSANTLEYFKS